MRLPKLNQRVELQVLRGEWAGSYSTYIADVDARSISVAQPMVGDTAVPLLRNGEVALEFVMESGERINFPSLVLGHSLQVVPVVSLTLPTPEQIQRYQLRDFVRLDANIPLWYAIEPMQTEGMRPEEIERLKLFHKSRTADISGSGAQVLLDRSYPAGTKLEIVLQLAGMDLPLKAEVVRVIEQVSRKEVRVGVRFSEIDERYQERIIRFVFSEQRTRRQKGLI